MVADDSATGLEAIRPILEPARYEALTVDLAIGCQLPDCTGEACAANTELTQMVKHGGADGFISKSIEPQSVVDELHRILLSWDLGDAKKGVS